MHMSIHISWVDGWFIYRVVAVILVNMVSWKGYCHYNKRLQTLNDCLILSAIEIFKCNKRKTAQDVLEIGLFIEAALT